jgi:hypothetical protein
VTVFNPRPLCFDWNLWRGRGRSEKTAGKGEEEGGSPPEEMQVHQKELTGRVNRKPDRRRGPSGDITRRW